MAIGIGIPSLQIGYAYGAGGSVPSGSVVNFATLTASDLRSRFGWSRDSAGAATYIDSDGLVRYGAHNLLLQTATALSPWQKDSYVGTPVAGQPDSAGGTAAISVRSNDASPGLHRVYQGLTLVSGALMTWDIEIKPVGSYSVAEISAHDGVAPNSCYVECSGSGSVLFAGAGNSVLVTAKPNGFYRVQVSRIAASSAGYITAQTTDVSGNAGPETPVGEGFDYAFPAVYFGGPNEALPTTSAARYAIRAQDYSAGVAGLLLEGARTNAMPKSVDLSTGTSVQLASKTLNVVGPMNTTSLATLVENSSSGLHGVVRTGLGAAAGTYGLSAHLKAGTRRYVHVLVDDGANAGGVRVDTQNWTVATEPNGGGITSSNAFIRELSNGIYRVYAKITSTGTLVNFGVYGSSDNTLAGRIYIGNGSTIIAGDVQLELGTYPTSYIPNATTGTLTRAADTAEIGPGAEFDALFPGATGTLAIEWGDTGAKDGDIIALHNGTANELISLYYTGGSVAVLVKDGGSNQLAATLGTPVAGTNKAAISWGAGGIAAVLNGGAVSANASGTVPSPTSARFAGTALASATSAAYALAKTTTYADQRTGAALQALTA